MELKDWLDSAMGLGGDRIEEIGFLPILIVLMVALLSSLFLSFLYLTFYQSRATGTQIHRSFPMLGVSICAIFITIQFSLPLSLGLLGALSIVRFRTPIKEPEEIGFVMMVVASSLCCATFNLLLLGSFFVVSLIGLFALRLPALSAGRRQTGMLTLTLPSERYPEDGPRLIELLTRTLPRGQVDAISEQDGQTALSYYFQKVEVQSLLKLQQELKEISGEVQSNIFYNRTSPV